MPTRRDAQPGALVAFSTWEIVAAVVAYLIVAALLVACLWQANTIIDNQDKHEQQLEQEREP